MPWIVRSCNIHSGTAYKRIWDKKSVRCKPGHVICSSFKRIFIARAHRNGDCIATRMDSYEQLVKGLCLPYRYFMADVCNCGFACHTYCIGNSKLPGNKSSSCQSRKKFENGIAHPCTEGCFAKCFKAGGHNAFT